MRNEMSQTKTRKRSSRKSTEAKLLITAASITATLAGMAMFAVNEAQVDLQTQDEVVAVAGNIAEVNDTSSLFPSLPTIQTLPDVASTPTVVVQDQLDLTGTAQSESQEPAEKAPQRAVPAPAATPELRQVQAPTPQPAPMGRTRSSR
jgi:hypothetical protein